MDLVSLFIAFKCLTIWKAKGSPADLFRLTCMAPNFWEVPDGIARRISAGCSSKGC